MEAGLSHRTCTPIAASIDESLARVGMSDLADALAFDGRLASVEDEAAFVTGARSACCFVANWR